MLKLNKALFLRWSCSIDLHLNVKINLIYNHKTKLASRFNLVDDGEFRQLDLNG